MYCIVIQYQSDARYKANACAYILVPCATVSKFHACVIYMRLIHTLHLISTVMYMYNNCACIV